MPRTLRSCFLILFVVAAFSAATAWQSPADEPAPTEVLPPLKAAAPTWYKGNLHTHSLWSDGDDFPEMIADWYKRHQYHFLALTEHNTFAEGDRWIAADLDDTVRGVALRKYLDRYGKHWVERRTIQNKGQVRLKPMAEYRNVLEEPGQFMLVPGEEITHRFAKNPIHMNAINLRDVIRPLDGRDPTETIALNMRLVEEQRRTLGRPILSFLNHPNFGWGVRAEDMLLAEQLRFFEVFNGHPGVRNYGDPDHASCERIWDIVLALRLGKLGLPIVYGMATDDSHAYHTYAIGKTNPGRGWVMVRAPYLSAEALIRSMEAGDYYCSSGVVLNDFQRKDKQIAISIRGEEGVTYKTQFVTTMKGTSLESSPKLDKDGKPLEVTRVYDDAIGKVIAEVEGLEPRYTFTGDELYVRAKITSTKPHPNPYAKGDVEVAWTQPMRP